MAVAVNTAGSAQVIGGTSIAFSIAPAGALRALIASMCQRENPGAGPNNFYFNSTEDLTDVNGVASDVLAQIRSVSILTAPTATTADLFVDWSAMRDASLGYISCTGVDQITSFDNGTTASGDGVDELVVTTNSINDLAMATCMFSDSTPVIGQGSEHWAEEVLGYGTAMGTNTGASSATIQWDVTAGREVLSGFNIRADAGGGGLSIPAAMRYYRNLRAA